MRIVYRDGRVPSIGAAMDQAVEDQLARSPGWLRRDAFVRVTSDYLIEDGTLEDLEVCYYQAPSGRSKIEVAGYAISDDGRVLDRSSRATATRARPFPKTRSTGSSGGRSRSPPAAATATTSVWKNPAPPMTWPR